MRPSTVLLAGATAAQAASLPDFWHNLQDQFEKGIQEWMEKTEDLAIFGAGPQHTMSFEEAKSKADQKNAEALENGSLPHQGTTSNINDVHPKPTKPTKGKGKGKGKPSKGNNSNNNDAVTTTPVTSGSGAGNGTQPEDPNGMKRCTTMNTRTEWRRMTPAEQTNFLDAVTCLMDAEPSGEWPHATNRYEDIISVHQTMSNQIHGSQIFLPWHRNYLHAFSVTLRNECGYVGSLPWWDETLDSGNFAASPLFTADAFGTLPKALANGHATCVHDGAFANRTLHVGPDVQNKEHCLIRAVDDDSSKQCNNDFMNACNAMPDYADMHDCSERGPHAYGHIAVGGVMKDVTASPGDPTFFLHHGFVDRMFKRWQNPQASRHSSVDGCADKKKDCTPLTMDTILTTHGLVPDVSVGDIMWTEGEFLCYEYDY